MKDFINIGFIGCGNISDQYVSVVQKFSHMKIVGCADLNPAASARLSRETGIPSLTIEKLLAHPEVDVIVNLTLPQVHASVSMSILSAGKHAYSEKPLALNREEGLQLLEFAREKNLRVGCATDTFLGAGMQTARKVIEDGAIGQIVGGTCFLMKEGPESWHPNPWFFYEEGGGPLLDMGPYYLSSLINLLGPVKTVFAAADTPRQTRIISEESNKGKIIDVKIPTHYSALMGFENNVHINTCFSFDVKGHGHSHLEIYGTEGSLLLGDPNFFEGPVKMKRSSAPDESWSEIPLTHPYTENFRGIGVAEFAKALLQNRPARTSGELGYHILDAMLCFMDSSLKGERIVVESTCEKPAAMPADLLEGQIPD